MITLQAIAILAAFAWVDADPYPRHEGELNIFYREANSIHLKYRMTLRRADSEPANDLEKAAWYELTRGKSIPITNRRQELWYQYPNMRLEFPAATYDDSGKQKSTTLGSALLANGRAYRWNESARGFVTESAASGLGLFAGGPLELLGYRLAGTLRTTFGDVLALRNQAGVAAKSVVNQDGTTTLTVGPGVPASLAGGEFGPNGYIEFTFDPRASILPVTVVLASLVKASSPATRNDRAQFERDYRIRRITLGDYRLVPREKQASSVKVPYRLVMNTGGTIQEYNIDEVSLESIPSAVFTPPNVGADRRVVDGRVAKIGQTDEQRLGKINRSVQSSRELMNEEIPRRETQVRFDKYAWAITGALCVITVIVFLQRRFST